MLVLQGQGVASLALEGNRGDSMIKRICDFLIRLLEKHGELVLAWNGVKLPSTD